MNLYPFFPSLLPDFGPKSMTRDLYIILFGSFKCLEIERRKWPALFMSAIEIKFTFVSCYSMKF